MDGKRKESIKAWFDAVVHEGERGRGHELHIDQIDESWEPKPTWMSAALESFDIARGIRGDHQCDTQFTVVVALFLSEDSFPLGRTFHNRLEMEMALSDIPPALFLWPTGDEFWVRVEASKNNIGCSKVEALDARDFFGEKYKMFKCIFLEHIWGGREEYLRAVYLAG